MAYERLLVSQETDASNGDGGALQAPQRKIARQGDLESLSQGLSSFSVTNRGGAP
jgi:hypothetical protein